MMNFNFGEKQSYVSTSKSALKPWEIHSVVLKECKYETIKGKKDPNSEYEVIKFVFENETGQFTKMLFKPKPEDAVRGSRVTKSGHTIPTPSNVDYFINTIGQILTCVSQDTLKKLTSKTTSFDVLGKFLEKELANVKDKQLAIKLIGDEKGMPKFPYFLSFFEGDTDPSITDNFISDNINKLAFSAYQLQQKEKLQNAKPSNVSSTATASSNSIDLDEL